MWLKNDEENLEMEGACKQMCPPIHIPYRLVTVYMYFQYLMLTNTRCLIGSIMMFRLFNDRFTFYELENAEKKYMFRDSFFLPLHIYRRHLSPSVQKMCPIPNLPLIGETITIFSNRTLLMLTFEITHNWI